MLFVLFVTEMIVMLSAGMFSTELAVTLIHAALAASSKCWGGRSTVVEHSNSTVVARMKTEGGCDGMTVGCPEGWALGCSDGCEEG